MSEAGRTCASRFSPGELPFPPADRAGVLVVQPCVDAHEVEVVRALRWGSRCELGISSPPGKVRSRSACPPWQGGCGSCMGFTSCDGVQVSPSACRVAGALNGGGNTLTLAQTAHPAPDDWRVIARPWRSRGTSIQRHVADAADVVLGGPSPTRDRVPCLDLNLHPAELKVPGVGAGPVAGRRAGWRARLRAPNSSPGLGSHCYSESKL